MRPIAFIISTFIFFCLILSCKQKEQKHHDTTSNSSQLGSKIDSKSIENGSTNYPSKIKYNELSKMSKSDLRLARNNIYATYGRAFESSDLKNYFDSKSWYKINPEYTDSLITISDKNLIKLITNWENSSKVFWEEKVDLDNDKKIDFCYLLNDLKDDKKISLIINDKVLKFDLHLNEKDYFFDLKAKIVDIDQLDNNKEIWISQHYNEDEDPGKENIFISKVRSKFISKILGSNFYNAGNITFLQDAKIAMNVSNCPVHTQTYQLKENELKLINEEKGEVPPEGCPACFVSDSKVLINTKNDYKLIKNLRIGDSILTYNLKTKQQYVTNIVNQIEVSHKNLVELYFKHDTITSTDDHPYYLYGKEWSSFKPNSTLLKYSNYNRINKITDGDYFILNNGESCQLMGHTYINEEKKTYTITRLKNGNTFYVNGILVGVEEINKNLINVVHNVR